MQMDASDILNIIGVDEFVAHPYLAMAAGLSVRNSMSFEFASRISQKTQS